MADDRLLARRIVREGVQVLEHERGVYKVGHLWLFTKQEHDQLVALQSLIEGYLGLPSPPRPLCLTVFGAPGSGKSFGVKEIRAALVQQYAGRLQLPDDEINLTQLRAPGELAERLQPFTGAPSANQVPFIFFDEYDAPLAGAPLGWLSWFLAPMQDGLFQHNGASLSLKRAVYIFAGGTADSLAEFGRTDPVGFRAAKGPDFVSRLRASLDVKGPNESEAQGLRRAVLIRGALEKVEEAHTGQPRSPARGIDDELLYALLAVGRYTHGARSIHAIIEMTAAESVREGYVTDLRRRNLPPDEVLAIHADRGPLSPEGMGGLIGMSGGGQNESYTTVWEAIARTLWRAGAALAYGGDQRAGGLVDILVRAVSTMPMPLSQKPRRQQQPLRLALFPPDQDAVQQVLRQRLSDGSIQVIPNVVWHADRDSTGLRQAHTLFAMRWRMACRCQARILISGRTAGYSGRMPGIFEEGLLALALGQPIYLLGAFGGATAALGTLLGLADATPKVPEMRPPSSLALDSTMPQAAYFRPAGFPTLPLTYEEALSWLPGYAIGGPGWPDNGLSIDENHTLFQQKDATAIASLIQRGLLRRMARHSAGRP